MAAIQRLEMSLAMLQEDLARSERLASVGLLSGILAHEFNNLLTPVAAYARMAQAYPDDRDLTAKALQHAADGADRCAEICHSILELIKGGSEGRAAAGGYHSPCDAGSATDVREAIDKAVGCLVRPLDKDNILLNVQVPRDIAAAVGETSLIQVLLNLLLNARRAASQPGSKIVVQAESSASKPVAPQDALMLCSTWNKPPDTVQTANLLPQDPDKNRTLPSSVVAISIFNSGAPADLHRLARDFGKIADRPGDRAAEGMPAPGQWGGGGLGLFICARIVRQAGGAMWVRNPRDGGTEFTVVLPRARVAGATAAAA